MWGVTMSGTPTRSTGRYSAGPGTRPGFHRQVTSLAIRILHQYLVITHLVQYLQGTESPVGYGERIDRIRRMSGSGNMLFPSGLGPSRMSPGPAVSGSMERSSRRNTPSRNTPRWEHMSNISY